MKKKDVMYIYIFFCFSSFPYRLCEAFDINPLRSQDFNYDLFISNNVISIL